MRGVHYLILTELNIKVELVIAAFVLISAWWLELSIVKWCILLLCIGMVITAEALNTAIEILTDKVSPDYHELAEKTKDVAAGGVLLASICSVIIGLLVFGSALI